MNISIALCTYNGERFLLDQLESYLHQTQLPNELIICDDGSSDRTIEILDTFKKRAPFQVEIHINKKNLGSTKNFEQAILFCKGDIIFLSDQDDIWMPQKVELITKEFEKNSKLGLIFTDAIVMDENSGLLDTRLWDHTFKDRVRQKFNQGKKMEILIDGSIVTGATMAFRSETKKTCLPIPILPNFIHDCWIPFIAYTQFDIIALETPLIKYRQHPAQQIGISNSELKANRRPDKFLRKQVYQNTINGSKIRRKKIEGLIEAWEIILLNNLNNKAIENFEKKPIIFLNNALKKINQEILHITIRRDMPKNRIKRISRIVTELLRGNYHNYSRGLKSAVLDFIEEI